MQAKFVAVPMIHYIESPKRSQSLPSRRYLSVHAAAQTGRRRTVDRGCAHTRRPAVIWQRFGYIGVVHRQRKVDANSR